MSNCTWGFLKCYFTVVLMIESSNSAIMMRSRIGPIQMVPRSYKLDLRINYSAFQDSIWYKMPTDCLCLDVIKLCLRIYEIVFKWKKFLLKGIFCRGIFNSHNKPYFVKIQKKKIFFFLRFIMRIWLGLCLWFCVVSHGFLASWSSVLWCHCQVLIQYLPCIQFC